MEEQTFFSQGEVTVTNARFVAAGQTYAMRGITSVKSGRTDPKKAGPLIVMLFGLAFLFQGGGTMVLGVLVIAAAGYWLWSLRPEFTVQLTSSAGEVKALTSKDKEFIEKVIDALNNSIIHRG